MLLAGGCRTTKVYADRDLEVENTRPELTAPTRDVPRYEGDDPYVLDAQQRFPTLMDFHQKVIWRTCTPNDGVCHNRKEYPDLHTPGNFLAAFEAPCNVQVADHRSGFDGCERPGDLVRFDAGGTSFGPSEIAWLQLVQSEAGDSASLELQLMDDPQVERDQFWATAVFSHAQGPGVGEGLRYADLEVQWQRGDGALHWIADISGRRRDWVRDELLPQVIMADLNRNSVAGALEMPPAKMLAPGDPEGSYLIARIRGAMRGEDIPGSRMPLANRPFDVAEMLALYCLVEGVTAPPATTGGIEQAIDYVGCSFSDDPGSLNLLGEGVTWETRVSKILAAHCGGCHGETNPQAGLALLGSDAYARLLEPSGQRPEQALIVPGDAEGSYLYAKLIAGDDIEGAGMPLDARGQHVPLPQAELADILTWITNGAVRGD